MSRAKKSPRRNPDIKLPDSWTPEQKAWFQARRAGRATSAPRTNPEYYDAPRMNPEYYDHPEYLVVAVGHDVNGRQASIERPFGSLPAAEQWAAVAFGSRQNDPSFGEAFIVHLPTGERRHVSRPNPDRYTPPPAKQQVVTHGYTDGAQFSVCAKHADSVPSYSARGASYSGVYHGKHAGYCDVCYPR